MKKEKVVKLLEQQGVSYVYFTNPNTGRVNFLVGTLEVDNYVRKNSKVEYITGTDHVALFSYTNNTIKVLPVSSIKRVVPLNAELNKARNVSRRHSRA